MSDVDQYCANLAACRRMADNSSDALEKRKWLEMAESWRLLMLCHDVLPVGQNTDTATPVGHRSLPLHEVLSRIMGLSSMINIPSIRQWLIRKAWFLIAFVFPHQERPDAIKPPIPGSLDRRGDRV